MTAYDKETMMTAYEQGFMTKCAERGFDPAATVKVAARGQQAVKLIMRAVGRNPKAVAQTAQPSALSRAYMRIAPGDRGALFRQTSANMGRASGLERGNFGVNSFVTDLRAIRGPRRKPVSMSYLDDLFKESPIDGVMRNWRPSPLPTGLRFNPDM